MNSIGQFLSYALIAVFAQNMLFSGATGVGVTLYAMRRPRQLVKVSAMISVFAILASFSVLPFDYLLPIWSSYMPVRGIMLTVATLLWYLIISAFVERMPTLSESLGNHLPTAALNGAVMGIPLLLNINSITDPVKVFSLGFGAGLGFALAAWLISAGMRRCDNPDIPPALRGAPVMLIYIGILSLAFCAFGGGLDLYLFDI